MNEQNGIHYFNKALQQQLCLPHYNISIHEAFNENVLNSMDREEHNVHHSETCLN